MAALLIEARDAAAAARQAGQAMLEAAVLADLVTRYRDIAAAGLAANLYRRTATAKDARRIARRFLSFEDMILRFATRPDLDIFTNNEAERTIWPVKVQQRSSGGCWRTITGLADFAIVQSYLSTAPNGASANSTPSATSSTDAPGCRQASNPRDRQASTPALNGLPGAMDQMIRAASGRRSSGAGSPCGLRRRAPRPGYARRCPGGRLGHPGHVPRPRRPQAAPSRRLAASGHGQRSEHPLRGESSHARG